MLDTKLYTLLKVAEQGSFTKAADMLGLTQPAVSQHIRALEEEYGVRIFDRSANRLIITREGEKVIATARAMRTINNKLKDELSGIIFGARDLNIGITHTVESSRIAQVLTRYASERNVTIKLISGDQEKLARRIRSCELDLAIVDGALTDPQLKHLTLDTDSLVLIVAPEHRFAGRQRVDIDDIKSEKLILRLPSSGTLSLFAATVESRGISMSEFNVILEVDNVATIKDLVRAGYGVSLLARSACADELYKGKLIALPIRDMNMTREINIIYSKDFQYESFLKDIVALYAEG